MRAEETCLSARGESLGRAAAVRSNDREMGSDPIFIGISHDDKMGSDPISLSEHFRHGLLGRSHVQKLVVILTTGVSKILRPVSLVRTISL